MLANRNLELNLFDTYIVLTPAFLGFSIFFLNLITTGIYYAFRISKKPLGWNLGLMHLIGMTLSLTTFIILHFTTQLKAITKGA